MARAGRILGPLDLLIATHAASLDAVLVTSDQAIRQMADLHIESWAR